MRRPSRTSTSKKAQPVVSPSTPLRTGRVEPFTRSATLKAAAFTSVFAVLGPLFMSGTDAGPAILLPMALLFDLILLNTFFSIRMFASVTPATDHVQNAIDLGLGLLYLWMASAIGDARLFACACTLMFALATYKYALLLGRIPHQKLLRHKIQIDVLGTVGALAALAGIMYVDAALTLWIWAVLFALVQLDIFLLRPLYVPHRER